MAERVALAGSFDQAIKNIKLRQAEWTNDEHPKNIDDLIKMYPEHADVLIEARKEKVLTPTFAKDEGLVKLSDAKRKARRDYLIMSSIRNASVFELKKVWEAAGLPARVERSTDQVRLLPSTITAIDIDDDSEVGVELVSYCMPVPEDISKAKSAFRKKLKRPENTVDLVFESEYEGYCLIQARVATTRVLQPQTLVYALWKAGALTPVDLKLAEVWRIRYEDALEGKAQ